MVWIIGEYAERIDNAAELIDGFLDGFLVLYHLHFDTVVMRT